MRSAQHPLAVRESVEALRRKLGVIGIGGGLPGRVELSDFRLAREGHFGVIVRGGFAAIRVERSSSSLRTVVVNSS